MKKSMSLALTVLVSLSFTACTPRNTYRNNVTNQGSYTRNNMTTAKYRDGVYTGYGDKTAAGNEMAIVTVRSGRIVDVKLSSLDNQGRDIYGNVTGTTGTTTGTRTGTTGTSTGTPTGTTTGTTGTTTGKITTPAGRTTGTGYGTTTNIGGTGTGYGAIGGPASDGYTNPDTNYNAGGRTGYGTGTSGMGANYGYTGGGSTAGNGNYGTTGGAGVTGTPGGGTGVTGSTVNNLTGAITGGTLTGYHQLRNALASNIIQYQTPDVTMNNTDGSMTNSVRNWKLAVRRALDQASR